MILSLIFSLLSLSPASTGELSIHISNVKNATAPLRIALYNKPSDFPDEKGFLLAKVFVPGSTGEATYHIPSLPAGDYAVAIYQDIDNNSKLNTNIFGYPKEPFCFSNNIKPKFSAPSFKQCKFSVAAGQHNIYVKLID